MTRISSCDREAILPKNPLGHDLAILAAQSAKIREKKTACHGRAQ